MSDYPLVSVIIPCYNEEKYIGGSIESFLSQTYPNMEIIVVDDGSTDRSIEIINSYSVTLVQRKHKGASHARNVGIQYATGDYIVFAEGDARYAKNYIETITAPLKNKSIGGVLAGERRILNGNNSLVQKYLTIRFITAHELTEKKEREIKGGWAFRREIFDEIGLYDESLICGEDTDFSERVKNQGYTFVWIPGTYMYHKEATDLLEFFKKSFWTGYRCREFRRRWIKTGIVQHVQQISVFVATSALPIILIASSYNYLFLGAFLVILVGEIAGMFLKSRELWYGYKLSFESKCYSLIIAYPFIMLINYIVFLYGNYYGALKEFMD